MTWPNSTGWGRGGVQKDSCSLLSSWAFCDHVTLSLGCDDPVMSSHLLSLAVGRVTQTAQDNNRQKERAAGTGRQLWELLGKGDVKSLAFVG